MTRSSAAPRTRRYHLWLAALLLGLLACSRDPEVTKRRLFQIGQKYMESGKYREASLFFRNALRNDRRFGDAYHQLGLAEWKLGRTSPAAGAFQRAFELQPSNVDAFRRLAEIHLSGYANSAIRTRILSNLLRLIERAEEHNPHSFEVIRIKGHLARIQGNLEMATDLFRQALAIQPAEPKATLALAESLYANGQATEAERIALAGLEQHRSCGRLYDFLCVVYSSQNRLSDAEAMLRAKSDHNPQNPKYLIDLAAFYRGTGDRSRMVQTLERITDHPRLFPDGQEIVGDFYLWAGEQQLAVDHYWLGRKATTDRRKIRQLSYKIIIALASNRRWSEAFQMANALLDNDPDDYRAASLRSTLRLYGGNAADVDAVVRDLEGLVSRFPHNPVLRHHLGEAYLKKGHVHNATVQFREAANFEPGYLLPRYALMQLQLNRNQLVQAKVEADGVLESFPWDPTARICRGIALVGLGEYDRAREELKQVLGRREYNEEAMFHLARLDFLEDRYSQAEHRLRALTGSRGPESRAVRGLLELYLATDRLDKAQEFLEESVRKEPKRIALRLDLAKVALRRGKTDIAIAELKHVISVSPDHSVAHTRLGEAFLLDNQVSEAKRQFQRAIALASPAPDAYLHIGTLLSQEGKLKQARFYFEKTLELAPDNAPALNNLAYLLAELETDLDLALTYAQRAKALAPTVPDYSDTLGAVYVKRNLHQEALKVLGELVAQRPSRATFRYHFALALAGSGDTEKAATELREALRLGASASEEAEIRRELARLSG
ncbi:MAG: tetratricopeptide repeat protein [bacterium]|nr:tetratricopeptide repeat protein [bacterium]